MMGKGRSIAGIVIRNGKILVGKRREGGAIGLLWEFPGGKVEAGERDEEAIRREFLEEFGVEAQPLALIGTGEFSCASGPRTLAAWTVSIPESAALELREHSRIAWVSPEALELLDIAGSDRNILHLIRDHMK